MNLPAPKSKWLYHGSGGGKNVVHTVLAYPAEPSISPREITTWSDGDPNAGAAIAGWSWLGNLEHFLIHFKPL